MNKTIKFDELYNNPNVPAYFRKKFDEGKMSVAEFESGAKKLLDEWAEKMEEFEREKFGNELVKSEIM